MSVLHQTQLATGDPHQSAELIERQPFLQPVVPDAVTEGGEFESGADHSLSIEKETRFFHGTTSTNHPGTAVK